MNKKFSIIISGLVFVGIAILSCTKEVSSRPNFIYKPASGQISDAAVVAKVMGKEITAAELFKGIENDIFEAEMKVHEIKMAKLKAYILEQFMNNHPKKKDLTNDQFLEQVIAKEVKVSNRDIDNFIKDKDIPRENLTPEFKERIRKFLGMQLKKDAVDNWIAMQTKDNPVEVYLSKPSRPVFDVPIESAPFIGKADAKVTVVEFSDFQCPFCAKGSTIIQELKKKYGNKIKVVFKNFPLPFHNHAQIAAEAGMCANEQGGEFFWKMHDKMFADQTKLTKEQLKTTAKTLGLNAEKFTNCLETGKYTSKVNSDMEDGKKVGVKSTPTFFVNGKIINGAQPVEVFAELIDEEMNK